MSPSSQEKSPRRTAPWTKGFLAVSLAAVGFVLGRATAPESAAPRSLPTQVTMPEEGTGGSDGGGSDLSAAALDATAAPGVTREATLEEVLEMAREGLEQLQQNIDGYTATLVKQERIGSTLREQETMEMKLQTRRVQDGEVVRPMRVYLRFISPESVAGQEVIWDEGANEGKLVGHKGGSWNLIRASLAPDSFLAMAGNRYPITQIGMTNLVRKLIERGELDQQTATATVTITSGHRVGDRLCNLIRVRHAEPNGRPDDFSLAEIAIDVERQIPLRYTAFGWPEQDSGQGAVPASTAASEPVTGQGSAQGEAEPPLLESYTYLDVTLNPEFTDLDFDPDNPAYEFP